MKKTLIILSAIVFLVSQWQFTPTKTITGNYTIQMKWFKSYEGETWAKVRTGMLWSFSYMGAMLPKGNFDKALIFSDSSLFTLHFNKLGFNNHALEALSAICDSIKNTPEYKHNGYIDLSRFMVLTLYSSYNYYSITNAEREYADFLVKYPINNLNPFGVTKSAVSIGNRIVKFTGDTDILNSAMVAEEGYGLLIKKNFKTIKFETIKIMPNGQFRYAIYDEKGKLNDAVNPKLSGAGKPAKCMWCHEIVIQPLFSENVAVPEMMSNEDFNQKVVRLQDQLNNYRKKLDSDIDFTKRQDHTQSELLYIGFMEPSAYRLKQEFGNDTAGYKRSLALPTHVYSEFTFLGNLYQRKKIDKLFAYPRIPVPDFVREKSSNEPDYFR